MTVIVFGDVGELKSAARLFELDRVEDIEELD